MWKRILVLLAAVLALAGIAYADSPAMPTSYTQPTGEFVFVMLAHDGQQMLSSAGKPYPASGLYRNDGSVTPLWKVDFYAFQGQVFPSPEGHHVAHLGPWPQRGDFGVLAVAFYKDGQLLARYAVADLVKNPTALPESVSHYTWQKGPGRFDPTSNLLTLVTHEDRTYRFDLTTGKIVDGAAPPARGSSPWWWIGGTLAVIAAVWFMSRSRFRIFFILSMVGLSLAGCGWLANVDPLSSVERNLGVPVTETGRVTVGRRQVIFFRFQKGNQCGTGHASTDGGAGWGAGPCNNPSISLPGMGAGTQPDGTLLVAVDGQLNNPEVVKVIITFDDGSQLPAEVGGGMYFTAYVAPRGTQQPPDVKRVQGFNKDGAVVEEISSPAVKIDKKPH